MCVWCGPVLHDETGRLFTDAGVTVTPQFLLLAPNGSVVRHGRGPTVWGRREGGRLEPAESWTEKEPAGGG